MARWNCPLCNKQSTMQVDDFGFEQNGEKILFDPGCEQWWCDHCEIYWPTDWAPNWHTPEEAKKARESWYPLLRDTVLFA